MPRTAARISSALIAACLVAAPASADAAKRVNPRITKVAAQLPAPSLLDVTVRLRAGRVAASPVRLKLMLSSDRKLDRGDALFGKLRTKRIKPRKTAAARLRRSVPPEIDGSRHVLACPPRGKCVATPSPLQFVAPVAETFPPPFPGVSTPAPSPGSPAADPAPSPGPGAGPTPSPSPSPGAEMTPLPAAIVNKVDDLAGATTLEAKVQAGHVLLASAGIGDAPAPGTRAATIEEAPAGILLTPAQVVAAVRDGHGRENTWRTDLATLADHLTGLGLPFTANRADGSVASPSTALRDFLAAAAQHALETPDDPDGHPVLLLAELARRQSPQIDITVPDYDPADLRLGNLDILLLTAQITRLAPVVRADQSPPAPAPRTRADTTSTTPCSDVQKSLEAGMIFGGDSWGYVQGKVVGATVKKIAQDLAKSFGGDAELAGENFDQFMTVMNILAKLQGLAMLYGHAQTLVFPPAEKMDKPDPGQGTQAVKFEVVAGVPDGEWEAYKATAGQDPMVAMMKDCAAVSGLPVPTSVADIGGAVTTWRVTYRISEGLGFHGLFSNQIWLNPGQLEKKIEPRDDHSGKSEVWVDVQEADDPLAGGGKILESPLSVDARVETDAPPKVGMLISAVEAAADPTGLIGPTVDLAAGLFQNLATINGRNTMLIRYAEPGQWFGEMRQTIRNQIGWRTTDTYATESYEEVTKRERNQSDFRRTMVHIGDALDDASTGRLAVSGWSIDVERISQLERTHIRSTDPDCPHRIETNIYERTETARGAGATDRNVPPGQPDGGVPYILSSVPTPGGHSASGHLIEEHSGCGSSSDTTPISTSDSDDTGIGFQLEGPFSSVPTDAGDRFKGVIEEQWVTNHGPGVSGGVRTTRSEFDLTRR